MNLPTLFEELNSSGTVVAGGKRISITYDGSGAKLKKTTSGGTASENYTQYYLGGIEYRDGLPEAIYHYEGRVYNTSTTTTPAWRYEYAIRDHLGNTRLMFADLDGNGVVASTEVLQENHFYPFGMNMEGAWLNNSTTRDSRYLNNGKELNDDFGLNWSDYGARCYDASIGRWNGVEPFAHRIPNISSYVYVRNNPISRLDPNGKWDIVVHSYHDRTKNPYGVAILYNRHGSEVHRFRVRLEGVGGRDRMATNNDTPVGVYDIPSKNMWFASTEDNRKSYGPNRRLVLNPLAGEILDSGRDAIRIHGGRQERKTKKGDWESIDNPQLKPTEGCFRAFDKDMEKLYELTEQLSAQDSKEDGGLLLHYSDLIRVPAPAATYKHDEYMGDGFYAIPGEGHENSGWFTRRLNIKISNILKGINAQQELDRLNKKRDE